MSQDFKIAFTLRNRKIPLYIGNVTDEGGVKRPLIAQYQKNHFIVFVASSYVLEDQRKGRHEGIYCDAYQKILDDPQDESVFGLNKEGDLILGEGIICAQKKYSNCWSILPEYVDRASDSRLDTGSDEEEAIPSNDGKNVSLPLAAQSLERGSPEHSYADLASSIKW